MKVHFFSWLVYPPTRALKPAYVCQVYLTHLGKGRGPRAGQQRIDGIPSDIAINPLNFLLLRSTVILRSSSRICEIDQAGSQTD